MTVEELQVLITANTENLRKEIQATQKQVTGLQKMANKTSASMLKSFNFLKSGIIALGIGKILGAQMDDAVSRLDALNNFPRVMSNLGVSSADAEASMKRLSEQLVGLPTTLDDATQSVQRFTSANGNVKASTEMFLALNNAILSGGANAQTQATALEQLSQAYAKGKPDMMEWRSAMSAMPAQLKQVAIAMGYVSADQLGEALRSGKVSMNEFMAKLVEMNKTGLNGFKSFEEQARNSTGGVATSITSVKTAITRGLADIMNAIGQANISAFFRGIASAINTVIPYIVAFVKVCATAVSYITKLFGGATKKDVDNTSTSISNLGTSATGTAKKIDKTTGSANKLKKALNGLATFDEMNVLKENTDSSGGSGDDSNIGGAGDLGNIDLSAFDKLETSSNKADEIAEKMKNAFKNAFGFINNLGFDGITEHIKGIGDTIKSIFTDTDVINAGKTWVNTYITSLKKAVTSIAKIGINIGEGLVGSIDKYLSQNKERVKNFIVNLFKTHTKLLDITGNLYESLADISSVFSSDTAKQIGADIISMFANPLMSLSEVFGSFIVDMYDLLVTPITDNVEEIKNTFNGILEAVQPVFDTLSEMFTHLGDTIKKVYDEHLHPFFDSLKNGLSDTFKKFLDVYNQYVQPFIKNCSDKFKDIWETSLKPLMDNIGEFVGNVIDFIKLLWEKWLKPVIDWIIQNIIPIIVPILNQIANVVSATIKIIINVINTIIGVLNGIITFIKGVFTGDWDTAWAGIKKIFGSIWDGIKNIIKTVIDFIKDTVENGFNTIKNTMETILNTVKETVENIWNGMWTAIKNVINLIIGGINSMIKGINKISFDVPDWVPVMGGKKWGFNIKQIPKLEQGGVVDRPTIAQVGENGREAIIPLERNTGWINELAEKLNNSSNGGQPIQLVVRIGEDTILDKIVDGIQQKSFENNGEVFNI